MASLVIELSSPNHLAGTAAGALLNIDPESIQQELTRVCFGFRSKPGCTFQQNLTSFHLTVVSVA